MRDISTKIRFSPSNQLSTTSTPCIVSTPCPNSLEFSFQLATSPTTTPDPNSKSKSTCGDYKRDLASGEFKLQWNSHQELLIWLKKEQQKKMIELQHQMYHNNTNGTQVDYYSCAQDGTGGLKEYTKKFPERERKIPSMWCSCPCRLLVKSYPDPNVLMGKYNEDHSHPIGNENARFTSVSKEMNLKIREMLCLKMSHSQIVRDLQIFSPWCVSNT